MQSLSALLLLLILGLSRAAKSSDEGLSDDTEVSTATERLSFNTEQLPSMDMTTLSNFAVSAGAAALGVAGLALLAYIILYILGVKKCHLLGTCDALAAASAFSSPPHHLATVGVSSGHYSSQMDASPYGAYASQQQQSTPPTTYQHEGNSFNKRSLDYVGPVLRSLASAYEKYENWAS